MKGLDIGSDFLAHRSIPGVLFEHNEYVHVVSGEHKGESGSLVCVHTLAEDPSYVLEAESGRDLVVLQSQLSRTVA